MLKGLLGSIYRELSNLLRRSAWIIRNQWPTFPIGDPHSWVHFYFLASFRKRIDRFVVSFWIIVQQQQLLLLLLIWLSAALSHYLTLMFSKLWCGDVDLQKLIKLLTMVMSTVRMDTVGLSGKHVIQSILLTWKYLLANADVLQELQEF